MFPEPPLNPTASAWSEPVRGLSGRLRVALEDLQPGLRFAVLLELRNHSFRPLAVTNQPQLRAGLVNTQGAPEREAGYPSSGPAPEFQWAVIPSNAALNFRIDQQTVGVPTREHGMALLAVGGKSWGLGAGEWALTITIRYEPRETAPQEAWLGELELPPIRLVVTEQLLATGPGEAKP